MCGLRSTDRLTEGELREFGQPWKMDEGRIAEILKRRSCALEPSDDSPPGALGLENGTHAIMFLSIAESTRRTHGSGVPLQIYRVETKRGSLDKPCLPPKG